MICLCNFPVISFEFTQKENTLQTWRNVHCFLAANIHRRQQLMDRIKQLNTKMRESEQPIKQSTFREVNGLLMSDYVSLGDWLMTECKVTSGLVSDQLKLLKKRRNAAFHVFNAPENLVAPSMSMHCHLRGSRANPLSFSQGPKQL